MARRVILALTLVAIVAVVAWFLSPRETHPAYICLYQEFQTMGTRASYTLYCNDAEEGEKAEIEIFRTFAEISLCCDIHNPDSELSKLNRIAANRPCYCSPLLWDILTESRRAYKFTGGAFDISVKPLMDMWGFYRRGGGEPPSEKEVSDTRSLVGLNKARFDDIGHTISFTRPGMKLDLGGIAKGFAVDLAVKRILTRTSVRCGVIDLGGNLRLLPKMPPDSDFKRTGARQKFYIVGISDPANSRKMLVRQLRLSGDKSLSTSGSYERFVEINGKRYGHIIDPKTGFPGTLRQAVTVIAKSACEADWLSTSVYLLGEDFAKKAERDLGVEVIRYAEPKQ